MKKRNFGQRLAALAAALALTAALAGCAGRPAAGATPPSRETAATESFSMDNAALAAADGGGRRHADAAGDRRERAQDHLPTPISRWNRPTLTRPARP